MSNPTLNNSISIAVIICSLALGYYFVIYIPERDKQERLMQQKEMDWKVSMENNKQKGIADCEVEAGRQANSTLKSRLELMEQTDTYSSGYEIMKQAAEKGLFNKDDYNQYYSNCIEKYQ